MSIELREATIHDVPMMQVVRLAVKENVLSNPALVTNQDCEEYIIHRGKGWVCEIENNIVAFAIADLQEHSIWALFVHPAYDRQGIGKKLHWIMLNWYFSQTLTKLWLSTEPHTRAEKFYTMQGWTNVGMTNSGEVKFEMNYQNWMKRSE